MKRKKIISIGLSALIITTLLASCGDNSSNGDSSKTGDGEIKLTYFNTSAEVNTVFEEMFERYHEINPNVVVELIPTGIGEGQQEKLQALYASGNAPTILSVDPANIIEYMPNLLELTPENAPWMDVANDGVVEAGTFDGKIMGMPFSVQGYGLAYNKDIVNEIYDGSFDPKSINTRDSLKEFLEKVESTGVSGTILHGANWSLGGHYLTLAYAVQGPSTTDGTGFIDEIKSGAVKIEDNEIFQGYMDTLDMLAEHNYNKADPLVADYNKDVQAFGEGKAATFFMGDWTWTVMGTLDDVATEYGYLPVPWSNDPSDYGNTQVVTVFPKFNGIDKSQSTIEEQEAALDLLEWMLTQPEGQQYLLDAGFCMPYNNISDDVVYNSMTQSIADYVQAGDTINLGVFSYISGDAWTETGNLLLQYVAGSIDRETLATGIDSYWLSQN